jgi:hypothetical protein
MVHTRCMLDKQDYMHARPCTRLIAQAPTRTHTCAHTYTETNMLYLLLFHGIDGFVKGPECYVIRTLSVVQT